MSWAFESLLANACAAFRSFAPAATAIVKIARSGPIPMDLLPPRGSFTWHSSQCRLSTCARLNGSTPSAFECAATSYSSGRAFDTIRSHASLLNGFMNSTFGLPFGM